MKHAIIIIQFIACSSIAHRVSAQATRITSEQSHAWFITNGTLKIKGPFSLFYDVQLRRDELGQSPQQALYRAGFIYQATPNASYGLGYAYIVTSRYGDFPVKEAFDEHRTWEQLQVKQVFAKSNLTHRYRLEQRKIGSSTEGGFASPRFENRARYMARYQYFICKTDTTSLYVNVFDEVFLNFGKQVAHNTFDQNRIGFALGYGINKHLAFEVGYLNQYVMQRGITAEGLHKFENNHTLTVAVIGNF